MTITLNGDSLRLPSPMTVSTLLSHLDIDPGRVAVEHNLVIVKRAVYDLTVINDGDTVEVVNFVGGGSSHRIHTEGLMSDNALTIAGRTFRSRLIVGTGKYSSHAVMARAHAASGTEVVTVAVRRVDISDRSKESMLDYIDSDTCMLLPNTAGCYTADDAVRTAHLAREAGLSHWVKLEVIGDEKTLFPDNEALLDATRRLVNDDFVVLPYTNDDPVVCRKLEDAGAAAVMPLGAPIGSGLGIQNPNAIRIIKEFATIPVIVDAGVGTPSDATLAMELGVDAILMNTGIAGAQDPVGMATAMRLAVEAGRLGYLSGRIPRKRYASASSPIEGVLGQ